jgi:hypothetical protein
MRDPHALLAMSDNFAAMSNDFAALPGDFAGMQLNAAVSADYADLSWIPTDFAFGGGDDLAVGSMPYYTDEPMLMEGLSGAAMASAEMAARKFPCPAPISAKLG